jgi:hypothetical protein
MIPNRWILAAISGFSTLALGRCGSLSVSVGNGSGGTGASVPQVMVVTFENANYGDVVGRANVPYLTSLLTQCA